MVSIEELEDKIIEEEVKARYKSIDTKALNIKEQKYKAYKEYTKKDRHPISYQVDRELERSAPHSKGLTDEWVEETLNEYYILMCAVMGLSYIVGGIFFIMVLSILY